MPKTPGKMHMNDMVKINTVVFEIAGTYFGLAMLSSCVPRYMSIDNYMSAKDDHVKKIIC